MIRKIFAVLLPLAALSVAFVIVSALLLLQRNNPRLLKRRLRIGALILALQWTSGGLTASATCYDGPFLPTLEPGPEETGTIEVAPGPIVLEATMHDYDYIAYSYILLGPADEDNTRQTVCLFGPVIARDGSLDSSSERVKIEMDCRHLVPGYEYELLIVSAPGQSDPEVVNAMYQDGEFDYPIGRYNLRVAENQAEL